MAKWNLALKRYWTVEKQKHFEWLIHLILRRILTYNYTEHIVDLRRVVSFPVQKSYSLRHVVNVSEIASLTPFDMCSCSCSQMLHGILAMNSETLGLIFTITDSDMKTCSHIILKVVQSANVIQFMVVDKLQEMYFWFMFVLVTSLVEIDNDCKCIIIIIV